MTDSEKIRWGIDEALKWADNFGPYADEAPNGNAMALEALAHEVRRLHEICRDAHDRILRGDADNLLMEKLEQAWKGDGKDTP